MKDVRCCCCCCCCCSQKHVWFASIEVAINIARHPTGLLFTKFLFGLALVPVAFGRQANITFQKVGPKEGGPTYNSSFPPAG